MPLRYLPNVTTLHLDSERCAGCGMCAIVCPQGVFIVEERKSRILDRDACMECGACALNCVPGAVTVEAGVGCAAAVLDGTARGVGATCECSRA